jgi:hypothetical protein
MALDPTPLTWLESLTKVFIDNFQRAITRAGTHHDLAQCKQNVMSSYGPIHVVSLTSALLLRISRRKTSSTASTTASPTQASIETLGGTDRKLS